MPRHGYRGGRGQDKGHGRHRGQRWVTSVPPIATFNPAGLTDSEQKAVILTMEELEAIRLVDLEGMYQEEAALEMGVSRKTLWNDLKSGRKKVAEALVNGWVIRIEGGSYVLRGTRR
jgi:predicted DNA-binding protein (UPF0251 family)